MYRPWLNKIIYLLILIGVGAFLVHQGLEPWQILIVHWKVFLILVIIASVGIVVQVHAFKSCLLADEKHLALSILIYIWSIGRLTSFIMPFVASLAARGLLFKRYGLGLRSSTLATIRQAWFNFECALVTMAIVLIWRPWPMIPWLGWAMGSIWFIDWLLTRKFFPYCSFNWHWMYNNQTNFLVFSEVVCSPNWLAWLWLWGQVIIMAATYWIVFSSMKAFLSWDECLLLACITIMTSIIVFIPQGIGIIDALWVWTASQKGLQLNESIAISLIIRVSYLTSAMALCGLVLLWRKFGKLLK